MTTLTTFPIGSATVVFTVSDEAGVPNTDSCSITATVVDDQSLEIACPLDISDAATDVGQSYASGAEGVSLHWSNERAESLELVVSLTQFPVRTSEVRYVAEDHGGN